MTALEKYHQHLHFWQVLGVGAQQMQLIKHHARVQLYRDRLDCDHQNVSGWGHNCRLCGVSLNMGSNQDNTSADKSARRSAAILNSMREQID